jgi:hypothetical protein
MAYATIAATPPITAKAIPGRYTPVGMAPLPELLLLLLELLVTLNEPPEPVATVRLEEPEVLVTPGVAVAPVALPTLN